VRPALDAPELLAEPVRFALAALLSELAARCTVAEIDPALADTAALCEHYKVPLRACANCVVVTGKRAGEQRWAGCVVLATTRADINGVVRRRLDVRKASFAAQDEAVEQSKMEYGGITREADRRRWRHPRRS
jgi:prolyl-tRNA editing enzyme YbaK/EbsC (Cys-tRNA(Pro) deacylase)